MCVLARSFVCRFANFHLLCEKQEKTSNSSAAGCGQRRRPCWYFNFKKCIYSPENNENHCATVACSHDCMENFW